ncbi:hypothetical protein MMC28_006175 [Mycoblastus sanguinarius]|nr:hypothetical protein [Mycoblastus sanguinarius]
MAQDTSSYYPIAPDNNIPDGYQVGFATVSIPPRSKKSFAASASHLIWPFLPQQDSEPYGQQSICTNTCILSNPIPSTAGPDPLPDGVWAAAIGPLLGGGPTDCFPCGYCYSIIQSGEPYCNPDPYDPACGVASGPYEQDGVKSIKILITNHCPNCGETSYGQELVHFDINAAPDGWNNPKIYWKQLDPSECL